MKNYEIRPYPLRMPPEVRETLEAAAKAGSRSLHAEILMRLEESLSDDNEHLKLRVFQSVDEEGNLSALTKEKFISRFREISKELNKMSAILEGSQTLPLSKEEFEEMLQRYPIPKDHLG